MSLNDENSPPPAPSYGRRKRDSALHMGPRKKPYVFPSTKYYALPFGHDSCLSDPLIHYGRHFGRTLHALCNIRSLITNGVLRMIEMDENPDSENSFTVE